MYIDGHCDSATSDKKLKTLREAPGLHVDFERLSSFMGVQFFALFFDAKKYDSRALTGEVNCALACLKADMERNNDLIENLLWKRQLDNTDKTLGIIGAEGGEFLNGSMDVLRNFYKQGLRFLGLTWNYANSLAGGADSEEGLSEFGYEVVSECEKLGIIIDGAHLNRRSFFDLQKAVTKPYIISHTCCNALCEHRRNLDDEQLKTVGEKDGVVGITFARVFLGKDQDLETLLMHILHAVDKAGIEHVGIGSDFDGTDLAYGIESIDDWLKIEHGLQQKGLSCLQTEKIMGENFKRVLKSCLAEE